MPSSAEDGIRDATVTGDRKSTRLNSSHGSISYAVSLDRKSTRLNSSHGSTSHAVFCLHKKIARSSLASVEVIGSIGPAGVFDTVVQPGALLFFNETATTEISTLSLPRVLPL